MRRLASVCAVMCGLVLSAVACSSEDTATNEGAGGSGSKTGGKGGKGGQGGSSAGGQGGSVTTPVQGELCGNGLDDNGDGIPDNGCSCQKGQTQPCFVGPVAQAGKGACKLGQQACQQLSQGELSTFEWGVCKGSGFSVKEVCGDNLDNDCDGQIDDGCPCQEGQTIDCSTACGKGVQTCENGTFGPCSGPAVKPEVCDGVDNDCDGQVDEGTSVTCALQCHKGLQPCVKGQLQPCDAAPLSAEVPDGIDNDCNGKVDETTTSGCKDGEKVPCMGPCPGTAICQNGMVGPCEASAPQPEVPDGIDNDCDGLVDETTPVCTDGQTAECTTPCGPGTKTCQGGKYEVCTGPACGSCGDGLCNGTAPALETCTTCQQDCGTCDGVSCPDNSYSYYGVCCEIGTGVICNGVPHCLTKCPVCGDGTCSPADENCQLCPQDCGVCNVCGDGKCEDGFEQCFNCPQDCGPCCGNGSCDFGIGETCKKCPQDCPKCVACGDGVCDKMLGETCSNCEKDCGPCCGDGLCAAYNSKENCYTCPQDCPQCPTDPVPVCGDGSCDGQENCMTCPADCGPCCTGGTSPCFNKVCCPSGQCQMCNGMPACVTSCQ